MPDMRDAIAQYLAFQGGQMPQGGGQTLALPPGGGPGVMVDQPPYGGAPPIGGGGMPPVPSNLQGYPQLPSGQFLPNRGGWPWPGQDTPGPGVPIVGGPEPMPFPPGRDGGGQPVPITGGPEPLPMPPPRPYGGSDTPGPGVPQVPPLNTPMQAPLPQPSDFAGPMPNGPPTMPRGEPMAEMDPSVWERMYGSGR